MSTVILPQLPQGKHIERTEDGDYAAYYDGQLLGYRPTRLAAEALADQHVYDLITRPASSSIGAQP